MTRAMTSPCIDVCRMSPNSGWCEGCLRSIDEIAAWGQMTPCQRQAVLADLPRRRSQPSSVPPFNAGPP